MVVLSAERSPHTTKQQALTLRLATVLDAPLF
jgi:hypothetical protein